MALGKYLALVSNPNPPMSTHSLRKAHAANAKAVRTIEVGFGAFVAQVVDRKLSKGGEAAEIMGLPLKLVVGGGLQIAGATGLVGEFGDDAANIGDGVLAAYFSDLGREVASRMEDKPVAVKGLEIGAGESVDDLMRRAGL